MITLIQHASLFAPAPLGRQDILIVNDRIESIASDLSSLIPAFSSLGPDHFSLIDASDLYMIPGLIDQHVHITGGGGEDSFRSRAPEVTLNDCIESGVTTLVGLLGTDSRTRSVRNVIAKAKALTEEGVTAYCLTGAYEYPSPTLTSSVSDDVAFIKEVIGCKIAISDHRSSNISAAELARLATQVRLAALESGKVGEVHMHMGNGKKGLQDVFTILEETEIPITHFRPTHVQKALSDAIRFANMGGYIDFTTGSPSDTARVLSETADKVPFDRITMSSDSNGSMPRWNEKKELIGMDVARMTTLFDTCRALVYEQHWPIEKAIAPVTETVAKALNLYPCKGFLSAGADADILLLRKDLTFHSVMAKGRLLMENSRVITHGYYSL